ncbi:MAG: hypothetical protein H8E66_32745 [Planctomycetes bacterium]|nr:hypothetical protein [Planctomycetota bacterium]
MFLNAELPKHKTPIRVRFDEVLRPEQSARLQQIVLQQSIRYVGVLVLQSDTFAELLGLNDEQHVAWKVVLQREHKRLNEAGEIRVANRAEVIDAILTDLQQAKFDNIYGERYRAGSLPAPNEDKGLLGRIPWSANVNLLRFANVRKELEVIEEQHKQLQELLTTFADNYEAAQRDDLKGLELKNLVALLVEREQSQLPKILLPHQLKRLNQLVFQAAVYRYRRDPLRSPIVAEALALTKRQQKELSQKLDEYDAESKLKRDERWKNALEACINALLPEQQARYYRLIGKPFETT